MLYDVVADEDLSCGQYLELFSHHYKDISRVRAGTPETKWRRVCGVAARDIKKDEHLEYDTLSNTKDIIVHEGIKYETK